LQKSFEHEGSGIYTRFLVEGLETGAADTDGTGTISILELHDYAKEKVQAAKPAMKPEIYSHQEGFNIILTRSPVNDPELEYRREVEKWVKSRRGEISSIGRKALNKLAIKLKLSPEVTKRIEAEVLAPYEEHKANLKEYEKELIEALEQEFPLSAATCEELNTLQQCLSLIDEDIARIELRSERDVDYTKLRDLLAKGKWKEANEETLDVMLNAAGREIEGGLNVESIKMFPCTDLRTIDRLWAKYSDGRFGFSVQKRVFQNVTCDTSHYLSYELYHREQLYEILGARLGWFVNGKWMNFSDLTFSLDAPKGHLPSLGSLFYGGWFYEEWLENVGLCSGYLGGGCGTLLSRRDLPCLTSKGFRFL
jgi:hypothetical protein